MLFLRYQRDHQGGDDGAGGQDVRRKVNDRDIKNESHRSATRGTLICIFVCGSLLLSLGVVILFVGLYALRPKMDQTPWLVIGPTCIVLGVLVLLLSVETIIKLRKISSSNRSSAEPEVPPKKETTVAKKDSGNRGGEGSVPKETTKPSTVHPNMQQLDEESLIADSGQYR